MPAGDPRTEGSYAIDPFHMDIDPTTGVGRMWGTGHIENDDGSWGRDRPGQALSRRGGGRRLHRLRRPLGLGRQGLLGRSWAGRRARRGRWPRRPSVGGANRPRNDSRRARGRSLDDGLIARRPRIPVVLLIGGVAKREADHQEDRAGSECDTHDAAPSPGLTATELEEGRHDEDDRHPPDQLCAPCWLHSLSGSRPQRTAPLRSER